MPSREEIERRASEVYQDTTGPFEGVREVGRAIKSGASSLASAVSEKLPKFSSTEQPKATIHRVKGPFPRRK